MVAIEGPLPIGSYRARGWLIEVLDYPQSQRAILELEKRHNHSADVGLLERAVPDDGRVELRWIRTARDGESGLVPDVRYRFIV
jgi:hypothetical protein